MDGVTVGDDAGMTCLTVIAPRAGAAPPIGLSTAAAETGAAAVFGVVAAVLPEALDDAGTVLGEFLGVAEPVAAAGNAGFPLDEILSEVQAAALASLAAVTAERDALAAALAALKK